MTEAIAKAIPAIPPPIVRTKLLTVEELKTLQLPLKIQGNTITIEEGLRGGKLKQPVILALNKVLTAKEKGLVNYIFNALLSERPTLLPIAFDNQTLIKMARHLLRHCSGSPNTCHSYIVQMKRYSTWLVAVRAAEKAESTKAGDFALGSPSHATADGRTLVFLSGVKRLYRALWISTLAGAGTTARTLSGAETIPCCTVIEVVVEQSSFARNEFFPLLMPI